MLRIAVIWTKKKVPIYPNKAGSPKHEAWVSEEKLQYLENGEWKEVPRVVIKEQKV
jgi:hypothetical protein